jgi:hypothetical protein
MVRAVHLRVLPATRGECKDGPRPCPLVSCRHHLALDIAEDGRLFLAHDFDESNADSIVEALAAMPETCALDVAERGGIDRETAGDILGIGHDMVKLSSMRAMAKIRAMGIEFDEREHPEDFYVRYSQMGADELAEVAAELRRRAKGK